MFSKRPVKFCVTGLLKKNQLKRAGRASHAACQQPMASTCNALAAPAAVMLTAEHTI